MLTPKLNQTRVKTNISVITSTFKEKQDLTKQMNNAGLATVKELENQQKILLEKLINACSNKAGWVNDPTTGKTVLVQAGTGLIILGYDGQVISHPNKRLYTPTAFPMSAYINYIKQPIAENFVEHVYLDSKGLATVGIGHYLKDESALLKLKNHFTNRTTGKPATVSELSNDFQNVTNLPGNMAANFYKQSTTSNFDASYAEVLAATMAQQKQIQLRAKTDWFKENSFDSLPVDAQLALTDMAYALGASGLDTGFPNLKMAVRHRDWMKAAAECSIKSHPTQRNAQLASWFTNAASAIGEGFFIHIDDRANKKAQQLMINGSLKTMTKQRIFLGRGANTQKHCG